ncbi:MAG: YraN family protein [bacterium]
MKFFKKFRKSEKNTVEKGRSAEKTVAKYLLSKGWEISEMNFTIRGGEIDIVAKKGDELIFVEVRSWKKKYWPGGTPLETITPAKIRHIIKTAKFYIKQKHISLQKTRVRFDVAALTENSRGHWDIDYIEHAFDGDGKV